MKPLTFKDIEKIGHTSFPNELGFTCIVCSEMTSSIDKRLLRLILSLRDYHIIREEEYMGDFDESDILFTTDLPYKIYTDL